MPLKFIPDVIDRTPPLICAPTATVTDAALMMKERGKGAVVVTDQDALVGIFTEQDVSLRVVAIGLQADQTSLGDVMTRKPVTIEASDTTLQALGKMHIGKFRHLPVMDDGHLINMVSLRDIYSCANTQLELELGHLRAEVDLRQTVVSHMIGGERLVTFGSDATVLEAAKAMAERIIGSVLITKNNELSGIFTERDVSLRVVASGLDPQSATLGQVMTANPETIGPNQLCGDILDKMRAGGFRHLPVID
ncbi:MAG: CBS domain-containing protein, partial [Rhodospirillales bacterium]|nr:CBS domain-containing protein [Rhodospirillales bacterium]